jgi:hypothetical protein
MRILLPSLLILAAGCTPTARDLDRQAQAEAGTRASIDKELAGLVPGRPQSCVSQTQIRNSKTIGSVIIYDGIGRGTRYVNQTSGGCERAENDAYLVTRTPSSQLCRGDIVQTVDRTANFPAGSCSLGDFVPYTRRR